MVNLIVQSVPASQTGVASGMNTNIRTVGASIGTALFGAIVSAHGQPGGLPAESGYTIGFALLTVIAVAATAVAFLVPATRRTTVTPIPAVLEELSPVEA